MKRGAWHSFARQLASDGVPTREIAARIGVTYGAVWKVLHPEQAREFSRRDNARPERKAAKRAADGAARAACADCGGPCGQASKWHGVTRCRACDNARRAAAAEILVKRYERLWREGYTLTEIAVEMGLVHKNAAGAIISMYRAEGRNFPYRRGETAIANIRAGIVRARAA